jgi:hypothetical protein
MSNIFKKILAVILFASVLFTGEIFFLDSNISNAQQTVKAVTITTHFPNFTPGSKSIRMRGFVKNLSGKDIVVWFDYGSSASVKIKSTPRIISTSSRVRQINATARDNSSGFSFYYRLAAEDVETGVRYYGKILWVNSNGEVGEVSSTTDTYFSFQQPVGSVNQFAPPTVFTNIVNEGVNYTTATLNGTVSQGGNFQTNGYFEWGTTYSMGNKTSARVVGSAYTINFSETINGLIPNTTYYYRAVAQNQYGQNNGTILSFTTSPVSNIFSSTSSGGVSGTTYEEPSVVIKDTESIIKEETVNKIKEIDGKSQVALFSLSNTSFFPKTVLGWIFLSFVVFITVAVLMYIYSLQMQIRDMNEKRKSTQTVLTN